MAKTPISRSDLQARALAEMGDQLDEKKGDALKAGWFARGVKGMQHYAWFTEDNIVQVHGMGPQGITYADPADHPRKSN